MDITFERNGRNYNGYGHNFERNGRNYIRYGHNFERNGRNYIRYRYFLTATYRILSKYPTRLSLPIV